jgi:hypothetical protein
LLRCWLCYRAQACEMCDADRAPPYSQLGAAPMNSG